MLQRRRFHMIRTQTVIGALLAAAILSASADSKSESSPQAREEALTAKFHALGDAAGERGDPVTPEDALSALEAIYPGLANFHPGALSELPYGASESLYALWIHHFYAQTATAASWLRYASEDFGQACIEDESLAGCERLPELSQRAYDALIDALLFDAAAEFAASNPVGHRAVAVTIADSDEAPARILRVTETDASAVLAPVETQSPGPGLQVYMSVGLFCGPSQRAVRWIDSQWESSPELRDITYLSASRNLRDNIQNLMDLNRESSTIEIKLVGPRDLWPSDLWFDHTPIFQIVENGQVKQKLVGWPSDDQGQRLLELVRSLQSAD